MRVNIKEIKGPWKKGFVLDRHTISSIHLGYNEFGRSVYDTVRSDVGEAMYRLKYRNDKRQVAPLVDTFVQYLGHLYSTIGFIVTMPPSKVRPIQPIVLLAQGVALRLRKPYFDNILVKIGHTPPMKDFHNKPEKIAALTATIGFVDSITNNGRWDVLVLDDLFDSGASLEVATKVLSTYHKVNDIYVGAFTKTGY